MRHGCNKRCPIVREQLRRAREQAREETDSEDSPSDSDSSQIAGTSGAQNQIVKQKSRQSNKYLSGAASPVKSSIRSPLRSHQTLSRESPIRIVAEASRKFEPEVNQRTQRRSKDSQKSKSLAVSSKTADPSLKFEPEVRSNRRSHESSRSIRERQQRQPQNERRNVESSKSETSSRSEDERKIPDYVKTLRRAGAGKSPEKRREPEFKAEAGPSRKPQTKKHDEESEDDRSALRSSGARDRCASHCRGIDNEKSRMSRRKKIQGQSDENLFLYDNFPYFENLCKCCYKCWAKQLWKDPYVKKTFASVAVFALGLKLCWELDGWTI